MIQILHELITLIINQEVALMETVAAHQRLMATVTGTRLTATVLLEPAVAEAALKRMEIGVMDSRKQYLKTSKL